MGILERIVGKRIETRETVVYLTSSVHNMSASQLYETQPALRSVISFLADNVAGLPLKCYVRESDTDRPRDTESQLARVLANPNDWMTEHELIRATVSEYLLHDEAYWLSIPYDNEVGWLIASIPTEWMKAKTNDGLEISKFVITNPKSQTITEVSPDDIIRFAGWSPHGSAASSTRIAALKEILSEQISAWNFRNSTWRNGGRVQQWISRPLDAPNWTDNGGRERFAISWKNKFAGNEGTDSGGTPILEEGMRLETTQFNAREAQWAEATRLSREDVCAVYHVNPGLIYHTDAQTYASAKDNARALYADTLAPMLDMFQQRINATLRSQLGLGSEYYCEFDLDAKLRGSFEEQAQVMQSSVGAPWMTRNEARARLNLPAIDGGDELVTPLNVLIGGQASPNDADGSTEYYSGCAHLKEGDAIPFVDGRIRPAAKASYRAAPDDNGAKRLEEVFRKFYERQSRTVLARLQAGADNWWEEDRWNSELADDLFPVAITLATKAGREVSEKLWPEGWGYNEKRTEAYVRSMCRHRAQMVNRVTKREIDKVLAGEKAKKSLWDNIRDLYDRIAGDRSRTGGTTFSNALSNWGALEGCRQNKRNGDRITKTWIVTSGNPRPSHAAMDGETVDIDAEYSNGAMYPGDGTLSAEDTVNCRCTSELNRERGGDGGGGGRYFEYPADDYETFREAYDKRVKELDRVIDEKWLEFRRAGKTEEAYRATVGRYISELSPDGRMSARYKAKPSGKELAAAERMAANGHAIEFLPAVGNGKHPDAIIDGLTSDFKRIESEHRQKVFDRVKEAKAKADRVIVDLSMRTMTVEKASEAVEWATAAGVVRSGEVTILNWDGQEFIR